jgi:hypothetical protein
VTPLHDPNDRALARTLGYAGLIPFVLLALVLWLVDAQLQAWVSITLASYAALIVSFLGGIHWGMAWQAGHDGANAAPTRLRNHFTGASCPRCWPGRGC